MLVVCCGLAVRLINVDPSWLMPEAEIGVGFVL